MIGELIVSEETAGNKKMPVILIAGLWLAVVLIFTLSSVLSYQGLSLVTVYEEAGPLSDSMWEINPALFWTGRILGLLGGLAIWFLLLRKDLVNRAAGRKITPYVFEVITIGILSAISWYASALAAILSMGFIDIQPVWADNAYVINFPVYVFAVIVVVDTVVIGIRGALRGK